MTEDSTRSHMDIIDIHVSYIYSNATYSLITTTAYKASADHVYVTL